MKLETFFEKFELFAGAPGAVGKMRELVLRLAVQGKLVDQDPNDEPAADCLSRLGLKSTLTPMNDPDETDDSLPPSWSRTRFEDIALVAGGVTLGRKLGDRKTLTLPYLRVANVKRGEIDLSVIKEVSIAEDEIERYALRESDLLMTEGGDWDKVGRAAIWRTQISICLHQNHVFRARMRSTEIAPEWFERYFNSPDGRAYFESASKQTTNLASINMRQVRGCPVPFPPLAEQKRIVTKVDELMALCDRLAAQQQERVTRHAALARASLSRFAEAPTPANLDFLFHQSYPIPPADLRKTILTLAVQGKLVPQDPNDEPAEDCLSRLGLNSTLAPLNGFDETDDSLPLSWSQVRFEDIALVAGGVTLGRKLGDREMVTLPYLRVANVKRGEIDLSVVIKEISIAVDEIERYALRGNDLLMTEGGDWDKVGRAAIWRAQIPIGLHQNHVFRARMRSSEIEPEWFERYFNSPDGRGYFESASKQTTNLASINMRQVRGCPVPFPPLAEQRRIVAKVDQLMALVDQLETQLTTSRAAAEKLMAALVAELTSPPGEVTA